MHNWISKTQLTFVPLDSDFPWVLKTSTFHHSFYSVKGTGGNWISPDQNIYSVTKEQVVKKQFYYLLFALMKDCRSTLYSIKFTDTQYLCILFWLEGTMPIGSHTLLKSIKDKMLVFEETWLWWRIMPLCYVIPTDPAFKSPSRDATNTSCSLDII